MRHAWSRPARKREPGRRELKKGVRMQRRSHKPIATSGDEMRTRQSSNGSHVGRLGRNRSSKAQQKRRNNGSVSESLKSHTWVDEQRSREGVRIRASVAAPQEALWRVLTDYERLPECAPNLLNSEVLQNQPNGKVRLRQVGASQSTVWRAQVDVELEVSTRRRANDVWEIAFRSIAGDLQHLIGRWLIAPSTRSVYRSELVYEAEVELGAGPPVPGELRRRVLCAGVAKNVSSLARFAELEFDPFNNRTSPEDARNADMVEASFVPPAPKSKPRSYLGLDTVKLPASTASASVANDASGASFANGTTSGSLRSQQQQQQQQQEEEAKQAPTFEENGDGLEVHLRRLDSEEDFHWRVLAAAKVSAHPCFAYRVLTDYTRLPEVVPQVVESKAERMSERRWRVQQVVARRCKMLTLRAKASLDVVEKEIEGPGLEREVQYRMIKGDFEALRGKWMIQPGPGANTCVIKYAAEAMSTRSGLHGSGLVEPLLECVAFEDVPSGLAAIGKEAERQAAECSSTEAAKLKRLTRLERTASAEDLSALEWHLRAAGFEGKMPSLVQLRDIGRDDLAEVVKLAGGAPDVASRLGWDVRGVYRPMDWWLKLENVLWEIQKFNAEHGLDYDEMPSPSFVRRVGRRDIARAMEYHSGAKQLARKLNMRYSTRRNTRSTKRQRNDEPPSEQSGRVAVP